MNRITGYILQTSAQGKPIGDPFVGDPSATRRAVFRAAIRHLEQAGGEAYISRQEDGDEVEAIFCTLDRNLQGAQ
jgi:hypothetical protein